jgi:elongation factor Tu
MGWWPFGRRSTEDKNVEALLAEANASSPPSPAAPSSASGFRLTVDDVFMITGRGVVVTGQVESGTLAVGQRVQVVRDGAVVATTEVSAIEKFRAVIETAQVGENVGLLMRGLARDQLRSGDVVTG